MQQIFRKQSSDFQKEISLEGKITLEGREVFKYVILTVLFRQQIVDRKWLNWEEEQRKADLGTEGDWLWGRRQFSGGPSPGVLLRRQN